MIRSHCSECSSSRLVWLPVSRLASRLDPEHRADAMQAVQFFGPDADAWLCQECSCFGVLQIGAFGFEVDTQ